ncbi:MAG: Crp/Fnr family transcriptional regulator [Deltaproteobacteria bacterium]|nr:Crp/Fnr family transcriptional regulator [Deltaproteobacteria bacterium]
MVFGNMSAFIKEYPPGTVVFEEHDPGSRMFVIHSGKVKIFRCISGAEVVLAFLGAGDFFGEMAILENLPRSASAEVVERSKLIEVDTDTFEEMIRNNTEIAMRMMRQLARRLRESDRRLEQLHIDSAVGRAIEVLRWLEPQGVIDDEWSRLIGAYEHIDIAAQAGISARQASTVLQQLELAGCMRIEGNDILIAQRKHLDEYAMYLDMRRKYDQQVSLPAEVIQLKHEDHIRAIRALLSTLKMPTEMLNARQQALASNYQRYFELKQRFKNIDDRDA